MSNIVRKKQSSKRKTTLSRVATDLQFMGDVNFGILDETKDGLIVAYDSQSDKFVLLSADSILSEASSDSNLPDDFITVVENEVDLGALSNDIDGGVF
jgi:hypothetical protein